MKMYDLPLLSFEMVFNYFLMEYAHFNNFYSYQLTTKGRASEAQTSFRPNMLAKMPAGRAPNNAPTGKREPTHEPSSEVMVNEDIVVATVFVMLSVVLLSVVLLAGATMSSRAGPVQANAVPTQKALIVAETQFVSCYIFSNFFAISTFR